MKALILVAGHAKHLRPFLADRPKALLAVAGIPMLRRAISNLLGTGVSEFVICTGYLDPMIREAVAEWFVGLPVTYVTNADAATTNNAHTLALAAPHVRGQAFFLVDGDVVFDVAVSRRLLRSGTDSLAVRMGGSLAPRDMKVSINSTGAITAISKSLPPPQADGESVGIAWLGAQTSAALFDRLSARAAQPTSRTDYYEAAFEELLAEGVTLRGVDIADLFALEIDTFENLCTATSQCIGKELGTSVEEYSLAL